MNITILHVYEQQFFHLISPLRAKAIVRKSAEGRQIKMAPLKIASWEIYSKPLA